MLYKAVLASFGASVAVAQSTTAFISAPSNVPIGPGPVVYNSSNTQMSGGIGYSNTSTFTGTIIPPILNTSTPITSVTPSTMITTNIITSTAPQTGPTGPIIVTATSTNLQTSSPAETTSPSPSVSPSLGPNAAGQLSLPAGSWLGLGVLFAAVL